MCSPESSALLLNFSETKFSQLSFIVRSATRTPLALATATGATVDKILKVSAQHNSPIDLEHLPSPGCFIP